VDARKGTSATLIIRDGKIESGAYIVAGEAFAPVRIMEDFLGRKIKEAVAGSPVQIVGFNTLPETGTSFTVVDSKKEAEAAVALARNERAQVTAPQQRSESEEEARPYLPLIIKTDVSGTIDAIEHEIAKLPQEKMEVRIVGKGVGTISEADVKIAAGGSGNGIILGFNVRIEPSAKDTAERLGIRIELFDVIYRLTEEIQKIVLERTPKYEEAEQTALCKVLKVFSESKGGIVLGGRVEDGVFGLGDQVKILRRDVEIGRGSIESLQTGKAPTKKVEAGNEFGAVLKTKDPVAPGDHLQSFVVVLK
jgi:translation initiation factor IF-2